VSDRTTPQAFTRDDILTGTFPPGTMFLALDIRPEFATEAERAAARDEHGSDEIEIDEDARISRCDLEDDQARAAYWVQGWLYVEPEYKR